MEGYPTQLGECVGHAGIPYARDLYTGPCVLRASGALQKVYQGVCQYSVPLVCHVRERGEDGLGRSAPQSPGGCRHLEGKGQSAPVLVFPDFDKPFLLEMDASKEVL